MKILYFTATGNSLAVAKKIAAEENGELISIPQVMNGENLNYEDDVVGFVFPTYGCMIPFVVKNFMKKITVKADYTFAIATYGMSSGAILDEAEHVSEIAGYPFDYVNKVLMLDNCQPQFDIAKQKEALPKKNVEEKTDAIMKDIQNRAKGHPKTGFSDKAGTNFCKILGMGKPNPKYDNSFSVDENCIKCGTCAKVCPMANITVTDHVEYHHNCCTCQACIHACPTHAIHFKSERNTERWRNPEVSLKEIIQANDQKNR